MDFAVFKLFNKANVSASFEMMGILSSFLVFELFGIFISQCNPNSLLGLINTKNKQYQIKILIALS